MVESNGLTPQCIYFPVNTTAICGWPGWDFVNWNMLQTTVKCDLCTTSTQEFLDQVVSNTSNEMVRMCKWYIYKHDLRKHSPLAIFTNMIKLQELEVVQGIIKWLWIFCINVTTMTPNQPFTTLSDHVHTFTTHSTVCTYISQLSLFSLYHHWLVSTLSIPSLHTIT